ncbi:NADPH-dependent FMN reductase [Roseivirga echinicomitans]
MKKIVAFAGSNSRTSINKQLVKFALTYFDSFEIKLLDLNDFEMPMFSVDKETQSGYPETAYQFREEMEQADAIICSLAEHNRNYTAAFKNTIDWCSRIGINIFGNKPTLLMSTSTGGYGAGNAMSAGKILLPRCGSEIIETFSLPSFNENFSEGKITHEALKAELEAKILAFKKKLD